MTYPGDVRTVTDAGNVAGMGEGEREGSGKHRVELPGMSGRREAVRGAGRKAERQGGRKRG